MAEEIINGLFKYKQGFTVVQNTIAKNPELSLKAKGLYLSIQANITNPAKPFSKQDLINMLPEGEKSIQKAWDELKNAGFLKITMHLMGYRTCIVEYDLLDSPVEGPHTFYYNAKDELICTNETKTKSKKEADVAI